MIPYFLWFVKGLKTLNHSGTGAGHASMTYEVICQLKEIQCVSSCRQHGWEQGSSSPPSGGGKKGDFSVRLLLWSLHWLQSETARMLYDVRTFISISAEDTSHCVVGCVLFFVVCWFIVASNTNIHHRFELQAAEDMVEKIKYTKPRLLLYTLI